MNFVGLDFIYTLFLRLDGYGCRTFGQYYRILGPIALGAIEECGNYFYLLKATLSPEFTLITSVTYGGYSNKASGPLQILRSIYFHCGFNFIFIDNGHLDLDPVTEGTELLKPLTDL